MFASLLPGLRDTRIPLVVGFAWIVVSWLAFGRYLDPVPGTVPGDIAAMARIAGPAGTGVAVGVTAYLVGVVTASIALWVTARFGQALRRTFLARATPEWRRVDRIRPILEGLVLEKLTGRIAADRDFRSDVEKFDRPAPPPGGGLANMWSQLPVPRQRAARGRSWSEPGDARERIWTAVDVEAVAKGLEGQLEAIALRLRGKNDPMYDEYDRLQAEADFRVAVYPAATALFIVLAARWSPLWLIGAAAAVTLLYTGAGARAKAGKLIASSLAAGVIEDQAITRLETEPVPFRSSGPRGTTPATAEPSTVVASVSDEPNRQDRFPRAADPTGG